MAPLGEKLKKELASNSEIIACRFPLPDWTPLKSVGAGVDTTWLYQKPQQI